MSERERDFDIKRAILRKDAYKEICKITHAAQARQEALKKELQWSKDEQAADLQVCKLRLERQIDKLDREESGEDQKSGPIVNLPAELLGYIFHYHVDNDMSAWGLVKVCKYWKKVALYTPRLWRYISIAPALSTGPTNGAIAWTVDGKRQISKQNRQLCSTKAQLQAALYRSGTVPLQVRGESMQTSPDVLATFSPLLWILLCDPVSSRIVSLDLTEWFHQLAILPGTISFGPFTRLSSIAISEQRNLWVLALFDSIESTACGLEQLSLDRPEAFAERSFWPRIKRLYLKGEYHFGLNEIAKQLVNIEELSKCPAYWPNEKTPIVTWAHIRRLQLECGAIHLDRLHLPNLEVLIFGDYGSGLPRGNIPALSFPNLKTLSITTPYPQWFSKLSAPSLSELTLLWIPSSTRKASAFLQNDLFSRIQILKISTSNDREVIDVLEKAPNLRTIEVLSRKKDKKFGLEFLKRLDATQSHVLCPKLDSLSLGSLLDPIFMPKKAGRALIKQIVSSRKDIMAPLTSFSVSWDGNSYSVANYAG